MSAAVALPVAAAATNRAPGAWTRALQRACARIAPNWPLDRLIAVNPWWGFTDQPIQDAAARLAHLCGAQATMPIDWYLEQFRAGEISTDALEQALRRRGLAANAPAFLRRCRNLSPSTQASHPGSPGPAASSSSPSSSSSSPSSPSPAPRLLLLTDALDARRDLRHRPACADLVIHAIGQHCASWFDRGQARWRPAHGASLYAAWRAIASHDNGPSLLSGIGGIARRIAALPDGHVELIALACDALQVAPDEAEDYFSALLMDVNGWASWCAYLRWQASQQGGSDDHLEHLLAIRLAWEWVLADCGADTPAREHWIAARRMRAAIDDESTAWIWQDALEITWQARVNAGLRATRRRSDAARAVSADTLATTSMHSSASGASASSAASAASATATAPALQAVFCIDVRSEPMRRALEAADPAIRTHGFAGFFGLPIAYQPLGADAARPQLPGLLVPRLRVASEAPTPDHTTALLARQRRRLGMARAWDNLRTSATGGFGFVETAGLGYAWKLLRASLGIGAAANAARSDQDGTPASMRAHLRPALQALPLQEAVTLAAGILRAMSLVDGFAPLVLLVGHGSASANNPHAAGLDCGACCGQSGEVNARVLADLLNRIDVRAGLRIQGIAIPQETRFMAALHNTATDDIRLYDDTPASAPHDAALAQARDWLAAAARRVRAERAPALGLRSDDAAGLAAALRRRAGDWSEVRPEWGLANNAGFIAAPRARSAHMDLQGRCFLHDYEPAHDADGRVLEAILTAPVIVAHWINMQYYASTVDNRRWGSGNKVLHNVVGGGIGVFEGNGGDLRIGLPLQSLHDGQRWRHAPLRLSVWVEAPPDLVAGIIGRHEKLAQLIDGGWLHLFCIAPDTGRIYRRGTPGNRHAGARPFINAGWIEEQQAA